MLFLAQHGFRVVAHDRRGHGRSSQPSSGNDMDGYADDLAAVIEALDLKETTLVGHSTGGGEVARYIGRYGTKRVVRAVLVAAVPPIMLRSAANPDGLPMKVFEALRAGIIKDRSHSRRTWRQSMAPTGLAPRSRGGRWISSGSGSMQAGLKNAYERIKAFSGTDFHRGSEEVRCPDPGHAR
jgi:non-heme chloroperoxidase